MSNTYRGKHIGVDMMHVYPLTADSAAGVTYGEKIAIPGTIRVGITPEFAEAVLYADNVAEDSLKMMTSAAISIDNSQLLEPVRGKLLGHTIESDGTMTIKSTDQAPFFGMKFRALLSTEGGAGEPQYAYVTIYKMKFSEFSEEYKTMEGTNIQFGIHSGIEGKAYARAKDGKLMSKVRTSTEFTTGATFFEQMEAGGA